MDKPDLNLGEYVVAANAAVRQLAEAAELPANLATDLPCPYCSRPEGWDACPIHRDHE